MTPVAPKLITNASFQFQVAPQTTLQTSAGAIVLELNPELAPVTVANMLAYTNSGFYDGTLFHRIISGFMVQGGGFNTGLAYKPPTYGPIVLESNNGLSNVRGTIAMARTSVADSATSQFFINQVNNTFLDYASAASPGYAVFGKVVSGLAVVDAMVGVPTQTVGPYGNVPVTEITILSATQNVAGSSITNDATLTVSDVAAGGQWAYSLDAGATWSLGTGTNLELPEGSYAANAIQVLQQDAWGNISARAGTLSSAVVVDTTAPTISSFGPDNAATGLLPGDNIVITFSEAIVRGHGSIVIKTQAGGVVESFDANASSRIYVSGNTLTIDPSADLSQGGAYTLALDTHGVTDLARSSFSGTGIYNFSTWIDPVNPAAPVGQTINLMAYSWKAHTLLSGVDILSESRLASTDSHGSAIYAEVSATQLGVTASRTVTSTQMADTASAVDLQDAIAILKMIVGLEVNGAGKPMSPYQALAADFDGNGAVQLADAIDVLRHVVGLSAPAPTWHFADESSGAVAAITSHALSPGLAPVISIDTSSAIAPLHVGLVGYLSGDVDGSYAATGSTSGLDATYFNQLVADHPGLNLSQFGIYGA